MDKSQFTIPAYVDGFGFVTSEKTASGIVGYTRIKTEGQSEVDVYFPEVMESGVFRTKSVARIKCRPELDQ